MCYQRLTTHSPRTQMLYGSLQEHRVPSCTSCFMYATSAVSFDWQQRWHLLLAEKQQEENIKSRESCISKTLTIYFHGFINHIICKPIGHKILITKNCFCGTEMLFILDTKPLLSCRNHDPQLCPVILDILIFLNFFKLEQQNSTLFITFTLISLQTV